MDVETLTAELSKTLALSGPELIYKGLLALIQKEIRLAELEIAALRERYDVVSKEALYQAIETGMVAAHPAWEDYIVWKNKQAYIEQLGRMVAL
jgi:hypothetical protein